MPTDSTENNFVQFVSLDDKRKSSNETNETNNSYNSCHWMVKESHRMKRMKLIISCNSCHWMIKESHRMKRMKLIIRIIRVIGW